MYSPVLKRKKEKKGGGERKEGEWERENIPNRQNKKYAGFKAGNNLSIPEIERRPL